MLRATKLKVEIYWFERRVKEDMYGRFRGIVNSTCEGEIDVHT